MEHEETLMGLEHNDEILVDFKDHVLTLTINRPHRRNALSPTARASLNHHLREASKKNSVGVIVITGAGDDAFCAGGDLNWERGTVPEGANGDIWGTIEAMRRCKVPIIAAVKGWAVGSGNWLAYLCDLTIAADNAVFSQNGARIGSAAGGYSVQYLTRVVGEKRAREMWYLCRRYPAEEAQRLGLVNFVVPLAEFDEHVKALCQELLTKSPTALKTIKTSFDQATDHMRSMRSDHWSFLVAPDFETSGEVQEGVAAFKEKREPDFSPWRQDNKQTERRIDAIVLGGSS